MKNKILSEIIEIILPERNTCAICDYKDEYIGLTHICISCNSELYNLEGMLCSKCSKPLNTDIELCNECIYKEKAFDRAIAPLKYDGKTKELIQDFKYNNKSYLYKMFGYKMVNKLKKEKLIDFDAIIPVPIHKSKMLTRGYNQSELLAKFISFKIDVPMIKLIKRHKDTKPQSDLSVQNRWTNIYGAFKLIDMPSGINKVLLVDDIYTTGATLNECSLLLKENGIKKVTCITIAR